MAFGAPPYDGLYKCFNDPKGMSAPAKTSKTERFKHIVSYYNERGFITGTTHTYCTPYLN
jgi:hypothetical protein